MIERKVWLLQCKTVPSLFLARQEMLDQRTGWGEGELVYSGHPANCMRFQSREAAQEWQLNNRDSEDVNHLQPWLEVWWEGVE